MTTTKTTPAEALQAAFKAAADLRALRLAIPSAESETTEFHRQALSFSESFAIIERAAQDMPTASDYLARMEPVRAALEQRITDLSASESAALKELAEVEASASVSIGRLRVSLDALTLEFEEAQRRAGDAAATRAAAIANAAEAGEDLAAAAKKADRAVREAVTALEAADTARAAVFSRLESFTRSLAMAQAAAADKRRQLSEDRSAARVELARLRSDMAAALYLIALSSLPADEVPSFKLPVHQADRVPLAQGDTVDASALRSFLRAREAAEQPAEWLERLRASGLLGFRFERPVVSAALFTRVGGA